MLLGYTWNLLITQTTKIPTHQNKQAMVFDNDMLKVETSEKIRKEHEIRFFSTR
jgi:hypothetical protein